MGLHLKNDLLLVRQEHVDIVQRALVQINPFQEELITVLGVKTREMIVPEITILDIIKT